MRLANLSASFDYHATVVSPSTSSLLLFHRCPWPHCRKCCVSEGKGAQWLGQQLTTLFDLLPRRGDAGKACRRCQMTIQLCHRGQSVCRDGRYVCSVTRTRA